MSKNETIRSLDASSIEALLINVPFPMAIFNHERFLVLNAKAQAFFENDLYDISIPDLYHLFHLTQSPIKKEIVLLDRKLEKHFLDVIGERVPHGTRNSHFGVYD